MGKHSVELSISQSGKEVAKICNSAADANGLIVSKRKANGLTMKTGMGWLYKSVTIEVSWSEKSSGGSNIKITGSLYGIILGPAAQHLRKVVALYRNEVEQRSNAIEIYEEIIEAEFVDGEVDISSDPVEKMQKLSQMHEAGLISEEEYNQKKAEILEKM